MKKLVVKLDLHDDRGRSKAMQVVSGFGGIGSLNMDMKDNKLTVSSDFDPIKVVNKLRKSWHTDIVSVGPAKEDDGEKDEDQVANLVKAIKHTILGHLHITTCRTMKPQVVSYVKILCASRPNQDLVCALQRIE